MSNVWHVLSICYLNNFIVFIYLWGLNTNNLRAKHRDKVENINYKLKVEYNKKVKTNINSIITIIAIK